MVRTPATIGLAFTLGMTSNGCFKDCDSYYDVPSYHVIVTDGATGARICDADVSMNGGSLARRSETNCSYVLSIPSPLGTKFVTLAAEKSGYVPTSQEVSTSYDSDECGHAISKPVKLVLTPE